jgi:hypothetical protein
MIAAIIVCVSRAGDSIEDFCRACKLDRMHTVIAADPNGVPIRVACGYCSSEHNYRGGPRMEVERRERSPSDPRPSVARPVKSGPVFPLVSDRERVAPPIAMTSTTDLELLLRRIVREESGVTSVVPADRWRGGTLVLKPGNATQEKSWPIETFFHKVVMIRNRLRSLEQQVNAMDTPEDVKVKLQAYISGCYGSLTSFNVLFADEADHFKGSSSD